MFVPDHLLGDTTRPAPEALNGMYNMLYKYAQALHSAQKLPCDLPRLSTDLGALLGTGIVEVENVESITDSLSYWGAHRANHPELYELATTILSLPASEASVERSFSHQGFIVSKLRTCLAPTLVQGLMSLRLNVGVPFAQANKKKKAAKRAERGADVEVSEEEYCSDSDDS
ncbi:hypothetical protein KIPB_016712, partial [Kipferlia bialata]|eukprot:g16712.t1